MTERNIKRELLESVLETTDENNLSNGQTTFDVRAFCDKYGYKASRVLRKIGEINAASDDVVLDCGTSPMYVWYYDTETVTGALERHTNEGEWSDCDECGSGGGGLCPDCKDDAMKVKR